MGTRYGEPETRCRDPRRYIARTSWKHLATTSGNTLLGLPETRYGDPWRCVAVTSQKYARGPPEACCGDPPKPLLTVIIKKGKMRKFTPGRGRGSKNLHFLELPWKPLRKNPFPPFAAFTTGLPDQVEKVLEYNKHNGHLKIFQGQSAQF